MSTTRRDLLRAAALLPLMPAVIGAAGGSGRRFLFVFNHGGWDPTRVLAPMFGAPRVAMEATAEPFTAGGLSLVDHRSRPSVRAFFEAHHGAVAVVNGILVPSVAHEVCARILMTGSPRSQPDWGAVIGDAEADRYLLPTLLMDAPTYPEDLALAVARTGTAGQLDDLVTGAIGDPEVEALPIGVRGAIDRYVLRHTAAAAARDPLFAAFDEASRRSVALEAERYGIRFGAGGDLGSRTQVAVDVLAAGLSRVVSIGYPSLQFPWDSHADNDPIQAVLWEQLFAGLSATIDQLSSVPGTAGGATLLDETVVVVLSEMGRTPALNSAGGKDHWPYTSALLFGGGVPGDLTIGGYDDGFAGRGVDRGSGEVADDGPPLDAGALGATLLALAGLDPGVLLPGSEPLGPLVG